MGMLRTSGYLSGKKWEGVGLDKASRQESWVSSASQDGEG